MKVILTQEVKGKGGEGDVVDVARGFAVNYLFPRKMAIEATPGNLKQLEQRLHNIRTREEARLADAQGVADALQGAVVTIEAKVGEEGRLFGSVTTHMVEEAISSQLGTDVDRRKMDVHGHIKEVGDHVVSVQVYRDIKADVTVRVIPEGGVVVHEPTVEQIIAEAEAEELAEQASPAEETPAEADVVETAPEVSADDEMVVVEAPEAADEEAAE